MLDKLTIKLSQITAKNLRTSWTANLPALPGSSLLGQGKTKEEAVASLFVRLLSTDYPLGNLSEATTIEFEEQSDSNQYVKPEDEYTRGPRVNSPEWHWYHGK